MRPHLLLPLALAFCLSPAGVLPGQEKDKVRESPYFPLKVGNRWVYRLGARTATVRVTKREPVGKVPCARLEMTVGEEVHTEHLAVRPDGVYRYRADGQDIEPPLCFLKLPPKAGESWKVASKTAGQAITGSFTLAEADVTVPAGKFRAVVVTSTDAQIAGLGVPVTDWFARGVGPVRRRTVLRGAETVLELQEFAPAK